MTIKSRPLTKRSICSDINLTARQKDYLVDQLETISFPIQWAILDRNDSVVVRILYPGVAYNPKDSANEVLPLGYNGGVGSVSIKKNLEKINYHYIRGINAIRIRFQADISPVNYRQRYEVSGKKQKALSGLIFRYYEMVGLVTPDDLVVEIISNIIIHAPSPSEQFYTKNDFKGLKMSEFTKTCIKFTTLQDIEKDLQEMRASVKHNNWISVNLDFSFASRTNTANEENIRNYAAELKITLNIKWE